MTTVNSTHPNLQPDCGAGALKQKNLPFRGGFFASKAAKPSG